MALIECKICGHLVSDKATACPNCGEPLYPIHSTEDLSNEVTEVEQQSHGDIYQSQTEPEAESYVYNDNKSESMGNHRGVLIALLLVLLALLGAGGWFVYDSEQKRAKLEQQLAEQAEKARQDSIVAAELMEKQRQDSITKAMKQEQINMIYNEYVKVLKQHQYGDCFLFDITKDGIPELWVNAFNKAEIEECCEWPQLHIYTISNNRAKKLCDASGCCAYYQGNDYIIADWSWKGDDFRIIKMIYNGSSIIEKELRVYSYEEADNIRISEPKITGIDVANYELMKKQIQSYFED